MFTVKLLINKLVFLIFLYFQEATISDPTSGAKMPKELVRYFATFAV